MTFFCASRGFLSKTTGCISFCIVQYSLACTVRLYVYFGGAGLGALQAPILHCRKIRVNGVFRQVFNIYIYVCCSRGREILRCCGATSSKPRIHLCPHHKYGYFIFLGYHRHVHTALATNCV
jgi:hypothetical protein